MLDVVAEQFLVLLLVMNSQLDTLCCFGRQAFLVEPRDGVFHVLAVGEYGVDAGT